MARFTAKDGCGIHYETFGHAGQRLALIPGLGGDGRFWRGVIEALQGDHRLVVVDHRGAGRSDRREGPYTIRGIAEDVADILRQTGGAAHIVGHSTGGAIAQILALDHRALGLSYTISSSWARADARFRTLFTARAEMLDAGLARTYQQLTHVLCHTPAYIESNDDMLAAAVAGAPSTLSPLSVAAARVRMLLDHDCLADLPSIRAPVQVLAAEEDILTPPALSRMIADAIEGANFVRLAGAHFHPLTDPAQFAAAVRRFVAGTAHER